MFMRSLGVLISAAILATPAGAAPQSDLLTLRGPGAQIGATFRDVSTEPTTRLDRGAFVVEVQQKSPAATSGIRAGDLVTVFDRHHVRGARDLNRLIAETPPGRIVTVTIVREGRARTLKVAPAPGR